MSGYDKEAAANEFAMALLMPVEQYKEQIKKNTSPDGKTVNTKAIAEYFGTTIDIAAKRGYSLGLLQQFP